MSCHFLVQGIFLTQEIKLVSCVSCIAGGFFTLEPLGSRCLSAYPRVTEDPGLSILVLCCPLHMVLVLSPHVYRVAAIAQTSYPFSHIPNNKEGSK